MALITPALTHLPPPALPTPRTPWGSSSSPSTPRCCCPSPRCCCAAPGWRCRTSWTSGCARCGAAWPPSTACERARRRCAWRRCRHTGGTRTSATPMAASSRRRQQALLWACRRRHCSRQRRGRFYRSRTPLHRPQRQLPHRQQLHRQQQLPVVGRGRGRCCRCHPAHCPAASRSCVSGRRSSTTQHTRRALLLRAPCRLRPPPPCTRSHRQLWPRRAH